MEWIKRNLLFVVGGAVALLLMGLASYYLVAGSRKNEAALEQLNAEYALLKQLNEQSPHPGDEKTDNITAARQQKKAVAQSISRVATVFKPVTPIPNTPNLNNAMFAGALRKTIDQLQSEALKRGVQVPTNFYFSFTAVRDRIMFDQAGLQPLAAQLGDVKAICSVLIDARVNALDSVRRGKVSVHDFEAQQYTDYLMETSTTNEISILHPYEVSFRCFSSELAAVLAGYASSPNGLIVRAMNVEPATMAGTMPGMEPGGFYQTFPEAVPQPYVPPPVDPTTAAGRRARAGAYGEIEAGNRYGGYSPANPYGTPTYPTAGRTGVPGRGGLPTMLDEKQIKVTMLVQVVKLSSRK